MSILSVDQIQPIGSGTTVTLNATEIKTGNEITVGTGASIFSPAGNTLTLGTNNVEALRIKNTGFVGIKTAAPLAPLHAYNDTNNTIARLESGDATCRLHLKDSAGEGYVVASGDNLLLANTSSITERLRITSNGDFGTNGVTPTTQAGRVFHLHAGAAQQRFHMTNNHTGSTATDGFEIIVEESANVRIRNFEAGDMKFNTGGSAATNEVMVLKSDGSTQIRSGVLERRYESTNTAGYRYYSKAERFLAPNGGSGLNFTITGMTQGWASIRFGGYTEGNRVNFRADLAGFNAGNSGVRLYDSNEITNQASNYAGGSSCSITVTKNNASYVVNVTQSNTQGNSMAGFYYFESGGYNSVSTLTVS